MERVLLLAIRERCGTGDHTLYMVDDGRKHCVVSREVGTSPDGCTYCLVASITIDSYVELINDEALADEIFDDSHELSF